MLAKIFSLLLGIIGVTATTVTSPTPPAPAKPETQILITTVLEKKTTDGNSGDNKTKTLLPVAKTQPKKPSTAQETKSPEQKKSSRLIIESTKSIEALKMATTSDLKTYQLKNLQNNSPTQVDWSAINQKARRAIVNILCTSRSGGSFEPLSGSGVIIDERGIILTTAHIAQFLLIQNSQGKSLLNCIARTGSPAISAYTLKVLYISPEWLKDNYKNITNQHPTGTGENDFALLEIASSTNPDIVLKKTFDAITVDENEDNIKAGNTVILVGYPAGFLGGIAIQRDLYIVSSVINIGQLFTFKNGTLDIFNLGGSPVAQQGSSGGGVVSSEGKLLGIIVTSTDAKSTSDRNLDAISIAHINRSLSANNYLTLNGLLNSNLETFSAKFNAEVLPNLKKLLFDELNSKNR